MADRRKRAGLFAALGAGVVVAGVAAERAFVRRDRARFDLYRDEAYGEVRGTPIGPVASFDGTLLNVEEAGAGPTVILSHGFSLNSTLWHHQILELAGEMRVVVYDHRGHGRSGLPSSGDWSLEALARDLDAVVNDVSPDEPVVLVGHSMGGMTVLKYCEIFGEKVGPRVAGIVLVDTTAADVMGGMLPGVARRVDAAFNMLQAGAFRALAGRSDRLDTIRRRGSDIAYLGTRLMGFGPKPSPSQVAFVDRMLSEVPSEVWLNLMPSLLGLDVTAALPAIDVPAHVIVGTHDRLTPPGASERIAAAIRGAGLTVIDGVGHTPMLERPAVFNNTLRRFMARVRRAQAR